MMKGERESPSLVSNSLWSRGLYSQQNSPGKNTEVGNHSLSRESSQPESRSPTLQVNSLPAEPPGKPKNTGMGSLSFSSGSFQPQNRTRVFYVAGNFFTSWDKEPPDLGLREGRDMLWVKSNLVGLPLTMRKETSVGGMQRAKRNIFFPFNA